MIEFLQDLIYPLITVIIIGVLMSLIQNQPNGYLTWMNKISFPGVDWFSPASWENKYKFFFTIRGRKFHPFAVFPFIMFTDCLHMAHGLFGLYLGQLPYYDFNLIEDYDTKEGIIVIAKIFITAFVYSTTFEIIYSWIRKKANAKKYEVKN